MEQMTKDEALQILADIARADLGDVVSVKEYIAGFDENDEPIYQSAVTFKRGLSNAGAVSEVSVSKGGLKVKMRDKTAAIAQMSKMNGWDAPARVEQDVVVTPVSPNDDELRAAICEILAERGMPTSVYTD